MCNAMLRNHPKKCQNVTLQYTTDDLIHLNHLGVCMTPDATVVKQRKMNEQ